MKALGATIRWTAEECSNGLTVGSIRASLKMIKGMVLGIWYSTMGESIKENGFKVICMGWANIVEKMVSGRKVHGRRVRGSTDEMC